MKIPKRFLFLLEIILGTITGLLFMVTLVWNDWIEIIFKVDPDSGNGSLERLIVIVLLAVTLGLFILARFEWRRVRASAS